MSDTGFPSELHEDNPDWEGMPGWEPWEPDECPEVEDRIGGCDYCGVPDVRDAPEPFGGKPCCDTCFNLLIGGSADDPPWRCGGAA